MTVWRFVLASVCFVAMSAQAAPLWEGLDLEQQAVLRGLAAEWDSMEEIRRDKILLGLARWNSLDTEGKQQALVETYNKRSKVEPTGQTSDTQGGMGQQPDHSSQGQSIKGGKVVRQVVRAVALMAEKEASRRSSLPKSSLSQFLGAWH